MERTLHELLGKVAEFLSRSRTVPEIASEFSITVRQVRRVLGSLKRDFDVVEGPKDLRGESTFVAVPRSQKPSDGKRAWRWAASSRGEPYGVVSFLLKTEKIKIIPLDGVIFGDAAHDGDKFRLIVEKIAREPDAFCFFNGDTISSSGRGSRGMRESILLERASQFVGLMKPIAHKILWGQRGCLEEQSFLHQGFDPLEYVCQQMDVHYFTEPCYVDLVWWKEIFSLWAMHGKNNAQQKGAKLNSIRRSATMHEWTHFVIAGHVGDAMWNRVPKIVRDPALGRLVAKEEFHVILGNFKRYLGTRASRMGFHPPSGDSIVLCLYPDGSHHVKTSGAEARSATT